MHDGAELGVTAEPGPDLAADGAELRSDPVQSQMALSIVEDSLAISECASAGQRFPSPVFFFGILRVNVQASGQVVSGRIRPN